MQSDRSISSSRLAMMRPTFVYALAVVAAIVTTSAEDFPLTFRTISAQELPFFPGGPGNSGLLQSVRPARLKREPKAMSGHPLYGQCRDSTARGTFMFRLDESHGDGSGYDRLIMDIDQNGDLTDDPVPESMAWPTDRESALHQARLFGPIPVPAGKMVAGRWPVYFAQVHFVSRPSPSSGQPAPNLLVALLTLKVGWFLDTTVRVNGLEYKVGVIDGDGNLRLGDVAWPQVTTERGQKTWYFRSPDYLLVDADGSGKFENDVFDSEGCPFGPILYLGPQVYRVGLTPDYRALRVEPWPEPLAEVALQPHGGQVRSLTLAWERPNGYWQLIRPAVADGKVMVPPGNYRLYACSLLGKGTEGDQAMVSGVQHIPQRLVTFAAGKANKLDCGGPLQIKVKGTKTSAYLEVLAEDSYDPTMGSDFALRISATVVGAGGEVYSTFLAGDRFKSRPPKPSFSITQAGGKTVATGNLEYG